MKLLSTLLLTFFSCCLLNGQNNYWQDISPQEMSFARSQETLVAAETYRALQLDFESLEQALTTAPLEFTAAGRTTPLRVTLPLPNGEMETFAVVNSSVLSPGIASRYPSIMSFKGRSVNNAAVTTRFSFGPRGLHAIISTTSGTAFIDPYTYGQQPYYTAYYSKDAAAFMDGLQLDCGYEPDGEVSHEDHDHDIENRNSEPVSLSVYTFGLACSGEYASYKFADTKEEVLAEMVQIVNRVNEVLENDVAVRLVIAENTDEAIFLDSDTDPYTDGSDVGESYGQTPGILDQYIGNENYDVGHSFIAFCGGGTVGIGGGRACNENINTGRYKGLGISCQFENNNAFAVELVAHEVGHQLSASHTFNNCEGNEENAVPSSAYEPGGGSTIMSYTGACGSQIVQSSADDYYHGINVEQIRNYTQNDDGNTCSEIIPTDNELPSVTHNYEDGFQIPIRTPFELTAEATDPNSGDVLTYCWEQFDLGPASPIGGPTLNSPIFRTFSPTTNGTRVFPQLSKIVNNTSNNQEVLPTYNRDLTFRCTVRDNNDEAGGAVWEEVSFRADETAGPFLVTTPNASGITWNVGDYQEVTWDVANTTNPRVNCDYVNIRLSTDGGFTYPHTLVANTANDGSAFVSVPDEITADARIRVEAANNIFFDISNTNFAIEAAAAPGYALDVTPASIPLYCLPSDPLEFEISTASLLDYSSDISLSLAGDLPGDATATFGSTTLTPGDNTTLTIDMGSFTGRDTFELQLEGTTTDLGTFSRDIRFIAVSTDFAGLELTTPANGTEGVVLTTDFSWTDISGADSYDFEIATSPSFGATVIESAEGLTEANYTPEIFFEDDELYFWRVRPINECGVGDYLTPFAFHTATVDCTGDQAADLPISLPANPNTKVSTIFIPQSGIISDLNVINLNMTFNPVNSIRITLKSPSEKEVILFDQNCLNSFLINIEFDDEAPTGIQCPPLSGNPVQPENPLAEFIGEDTQGEWELIVQVVNAGFGTGSINSWGLDFCSTVIAEAPVLITNETLEVPPGQGNTITKNLLEVTDNVASPSQVKYILVEVPENGDLFRAGDNDPLLPGESFTQQTINSLNLSYVHDGSATTSDAFIFVVEDNEGGWIPNQTFNIVIDEDATVNTNDLSLDNNITLFPNPADDVISLKLQQPLTDDAGLRVLTAHGQVVQQHTLDAGLQQMELYTNNLPVGIYWVEISTETGQLTQKLVIQR
jgi:subtilisin-like proprotein convertase family protein